jgi:hypothetical protein
VSVLAFSLPCVLPIEMYRRSGISDGVCCAWWHDASGSLFRYGHIVRCMWKERECCVLAVFPWCHLRPFLLARSCMQLLIGDSRAYVTFCDVNEAEGKVVEKELTDQGLT